MTSNDVLTLLEASDLDLVGGVNLFVGKEPSTPDNTVTIYDTPGGKPDVTYKGNRYSYPAVQIRVRNISYQACSNLIDAIEEELHNKANILVNNTFYLTIEATNSPGFLDWDNNDRARFIINFTMKSKPIGG